MQLRLLALRLAIMAILLEMGAGTALAADALIETVAKIKPSIVAVGTYQKTRNPSAAFNGTGFVVADGLHVITNAHILPRELSVENKETMIVLVKRAEQVDNRQAQIIAVDHARDLALLQIEGPALPAVTIGDSASMREGQALAFIGFPVGMALGLYPATHRATLSALVPIARAGITARQLNPSMINRLRDSAYVVFQLDATAYPGNSGSPVFDPVTAHVYGIINSVFIQGTREQAITKPSGITYAIPSAYIQDLLDQVRRAGALR